MLSVWEGLPGPRTQEQAPHPPGRCHQKTTHLTSRNTQEGDRPAPTCRQRPPAQRAPPHCPAGSVAAVTGKRSHRQCLDTQSRLGQPLREAPAATRSGTPRPTATTCPSEDNPQTLKADPTGEEETDQASSQPRKQIWDQTQREGGCGTEDIVVKPQAAPPRPQSSRAAVGRWFRGGSARQSRDPGPLSQEDTPGTGHCPSGRVATFCTWPPQSVPPAEATQRPHCPRSSPREALSTKPGPAYRSRLRWGHRGAVSCADTFCPSRHRSSGLQALHVPRVHREPVPL